MRLILLAIFALAQTPTLAPHRLRAGDTLSIVVNGVPSAAVNGTPNSAVNGMPFSGEYQVLDDGAIYGTGFGRVQVAGKTWAEAQNAIRRALSKYVRPREVMLALKSQRLESVYLVSPTGKGDVPYRPSMTLRQLIATSEVDKDADQTEVQLFRGNGVPQQFNLAELLSKNGPADTVLQPNDVVTLTPVAFLRVWVTGSVKEPGLVRVPANSDPFQAVAAAGGLLKEQNATDPLEDYTILIRRGDQTIELPARPTKETPPKLQSGDALTVQPAPTIRFTVAGEVDKPGEFTTRGETDLVRAVAAASGATPDASLSDVVVVRNGTMARYDLSGLRNGSPLPKVVLQRDDVVVLLKNERVFYVFGEVNRPGKFSMREDKVYRLTDALAESGGIKDRGVLRRISVARPSAEGKFVVTQYNLDEFLKDGKQAANPEIKPGDMILFTTSRGITANTAVQALSAAFLFQNLTGLGR